MSTNQLELNFVHYAWCPDLYFGECLAGDFNQEGDFTMSGVASTLGLLDLVAWWLVWCDRLGMMALITSAGLVGNVIDVTWMDGMGYVIKMFGSAVVTGRSVFGTGQCNTS